MAEIPSDIASSAAQAGFQAREVAKERDARRTGAATAANRQVKAVDEAGTHVDTEDGDTAVFADAEGAGSQGRASEETATDDALADDTFADEAAADAHGKREDSGGVTTDDDGQSHLDIEA